MRLEISWSFAYEVKESVTADFILSAVTDSKNKLIPLSISIIMVSSI